MNSINLISVVVLVLLTFSACQKNPGPDPDGTYNPDIDPANFTNSTLLTNTYFAYEVGTKYTFEGETEEGLETITIERLDTTKQVMNIACAVVNEKNFVDGKLVEDTYDWYAQDNSGNVWYMGEEVNDYDTDGNLIGHEGAWEAGVDGAKPGIIMLADPEVGMSYRQEYYANVAEDQAEVVETGLTVTVPYGTFDNCIKIGETTALEPDVLEYKIYTSVVGLIKEINATDDEEINLINLQQ